MAIVEKGRKYVFSLEGTREEKLANATDSTRGRRTASLYNRRPTTKGRQADRGQCAMHSGTQLRTVSMVGDEEQQRHQAALRRSKWYYAMLGDTRCFRASACALLLVSC